MPAAKLSNAIPAIKFKNKAGVHLIKRVPRRLLRIHALTRTLHTLSPEEQFNSRIPQEVHWHCPRIRGFRQKEPQFGRSSDNRRFRFPNYSAWRRSQTESLLSNARCFISSPPCARFARALGAPRTAHSLRPRWGLARLLLRWSWNPNLLVFFP